MLVEFGCCLHIVYTVCLLCRCFAYGNGFPTKCVICKAFRLFFGMCVVNRDV